MTDASIVAMNDQHSYLALTGGDAASDARFGGVGSVVSLGLSHPCTTFDKWRYLPVVAAQDSPTAVSLVRTFF